MTDIIDKKIEEFDTKEWLENMCYATGLDPKDEKWNIILVLIEQKVKARVLQVREEAQNQHNQDCKREEWMEEKIKLAIAEERERVRGEIEAGVEKYKLSKQVGNMAGDYIFTYDLETFVLSSLDPLTDKE